MIGLRQPLKEHTRFLVMSTRGRRRLVDNTKRCRFFCQNPQEDRQCNPPQKGLGKQHSDDGEEAHTTDSPAAAGRGLA